MKIITISREFGSGGRELGKRLADALLEKENVAAIFSTVVSGYKTENGALCGLQLHNDVGVIGDEAALSKVVAAGAEVYK